MDFYSSHFISDHCQSILNFYEDKVVDKSGGYYQNYHDDGSYFNEGARHLVSSARIVMNFALAGKFFNNPEYLIIAKHGIDYVEKVHWQEDQQGYAWLIDNHQPADMTQQAYGYAFVLMMYAAARKANLISDDKPMLALYELLEERFWQAEFGLYGDELDGNGQLTSYRGQNSNMHMCEAMIACFEATNNNVFLSRAKVIAENIVQKQASLTDGLIWEHYTVNFEPDWEYNKSDPKNIYRPWGFQPGHQTEWTQLLLLINRYAPNKWLIKRAEQLFNAAFETAWDKDHGGLFYGFAPDGSICDDDKYFWVQAESIASAAMLYTETENRTYLNAYNQLWQYSWDNMIDHKFGAWYRILQQNNRKYSTKKSECGAKCDYHTIGACFKVLQSKGIINVDQLSFTRSH